MGCVLHALNERLFMKLRNRPRSNAMFDKLRSGLVTGAADDDTSGIAIYPLMAAVQLVSAHTRVSIMARTRSRN